MGKYTDLKPPARWERQFNAFKRVGKLRLGRQITKTERYPKETDYFRLDTDNPVFRKNFIDKFGEQCPACGGNGCGSCGKLGYIFKKIRVCFPSEDLKVFAPKSLEHWRGSGMRCTGDGGECTRYLIACSKCGHEFLGEDWRFNWTDKGWRHEDVNLRGKCPNCQHGGKNRLRRILPCPATECDAFKKGFCKRIMRINVYVPEVYAGGVFTVETGSGNVMFFTLEEDLDALRDAFGHVAMLMEDPGNTPLVVMHRQAHQTRQEHPATHYLVRFSTRSDVNVDSVQKYHQQFFERTLPAGVAPKALPVPEQIPEEQFPREIVEEAQRSVEVPFDYDEAAIINGEILDASDVGTAPETQGPAPETQGPAPETQGPAPETQGPAPERKAPEDVLAHWFGSLPSVLKAFADKGITSLEEVPRTVEDLIKIKGIGPKKAKKVLEVMRVEGVQQAQPTKPAEPQPEPVHKAVETKDPVLAQIEQLLRGQSDYNDQTIEIMLEAAGVSPEAAQQTLANLQERYGQTAEPAEPAAEPEPEESEPKSGLFGEDLGTADLGI